MSGFKSFALIPAAGMGKRMGASINKQYLQLDGLPIVARTIAVFEQSPLIEAIYLVIPADEIPYCRDRARWQGAAELGHERTECHASECGRR
jgi:2-C-methyl-D-erythritol 4-phosphate cytidylyltransferase